MLTDEQIAKNKQEYLALIRTVNRPGMPELIAWLEKSDFFEAPSSCNYHSNFKGGLCDHSLNVYRCALRIRTHYQELMKQKGKEPLNITDEEIIVTPLLHDICKIHFYRPAIKHYKHPEMGWIDYMGYEVDDKFPCGHGEKSVIIAQQFVKLTGPEILAIRYHMGYGTVGSHLDPNEKYPIARAMEICPLVFIIWNADQTAAFLLEDTETQWDKRV